VTFDLAAVGTKGEIATVEWSPQDVIIYALGVGAGQADPAAELQFTTENSIDVQLQVLPGFGVVQAMTRGRRPNVGPIPLAKVLHGEQSFVSHEPLTPTGSATVEATLLGIYDQGSSAHMVTEFALNDLETGRLLLTATSTIVIRGEGGFGGERRPTTPWARPDTPAALQVNALVRRDQPLLYRLSGDRNPLHSDPAFARRAGFDRPILHGMCTFGIASRLLINELGGGDARTARAMSGRFSKPVIPGDTLTVKAWPTPEGALFVVEDSVGDVVLDRGSFALDAG
jgi:acyl dehydratase